MTERVNIPKWALYTMIASISILTILSSSLIITLNSKNMEEERTNIGLDKDTGEETDIELNKDTEEEKIKELEDKRIRDEKFRAEDDAIKALKLTTVEAQVPKGWDIKLEYNTPELVPRGIDCEGLTGLEIMKGENLIFKMQLISGVGGQCLDYYLFKDTPAPSEAESEYQVTDLTKQKYTQINILGNIYRRIGTQFYQDDDRETEAFESRCDTYMTEIDGMIVKSSYEGSYYSIVNSYTFTVTPNTSETDLKVLDSILESMTLVEYEG